MNDNKIIIQGLSELIGWDVISDDINVKSISIASSSTVSSNFLGSKALTGRIAGSTADIVIKLGNIKFPGINLDCNKTDLKIFMLDASGTFILTNCMISSYEWFGTFEEDDSDEIRLSIMYDIHKVVSEPYIPPIEHKLKKLGLW